MPATVGGQSNPFLTFAVTPHASGAHLVHLGDDWETFYAAKRSSATRRRDRTKRKHMSKFGAVGFATASAADEVRQTLEQLMRQKSRSLKARGIADMFARPGYREFFLDLASRPNAAETYHVSRVEIGEACAAANFGIVFGDCYYHVLASYDDAGFAQYGPGALHLRELMAYAIGRGLRRFDFTIGDEPYKREWSDTHIDLYDYVAAATWLGVPAHWRVALQAHIKRFIKQTPWAWRLVGLVRTARGALSRPRRARGPAAMARFGPPAPSAIACVVGDMDLLRPLALAGVPCAAIARPGVPSLYSRYAQPAIAWDDFSGDPATLVETLASFGKAQTTPPILFYEEDALVLLVSRCRDRLAEAFRFVIADPALVEDLLDKARFQELAARHNLPMPLARGFDPHKLAPSELALRFPVIIKPLTRLERWNSYWGRRKALRADNDDALRALWPRFQEAGVALLAQELVSGPESQIESYHCYIDHEGRIAGEFTGRKIRTWPLDYGHTTALEITEAEDVARLGREVIEKIGLTGVAKLDFKRDGQGILRLLEIKPRFNLWHHAGAIAGVNIPALVYADLTGLRRPPQVRIRAGVRWCHAWSDFTAARASGISTPAWLRFLAGCEAKSSLAVDDPAPLLASAFYRLGARG